MIEKDEVIDLGYKMNRELFIKVFKENGAKCLCKLNTTCPCPDFIDGLECKCGVFVKVKK
jgi:hypothetical protein